MSAAAPEKKAGRNLGSLPGNRRLIHFVDDMDMPELVLYKFMLAAAPLEKNFDSSTSWMT